MEGSLLYRAEQCVRGSEKSSKVMEVSSVCEAVRKSSRVMEVSSVCEAVRKVVSRWKGVLSVDGSELSEKRKRIGSQDDFSGELLRRKAR